VGRFDHGGGQRETRRGSARGLEVGATHGAIRVGDHGGPASVGFLADPDVERQRAEQRHAVLLRHPHAAAGAEDRLLVAALRADVGAHVFHHAQHRDRDLLEHAQALAGVEQRDVLRRGDDHGAAHRDALRERELDVAGAGRHVDDQVVELAPVGVAQQLGERLGDHRATPDHRLLLLDQESDRDDLDAVSLERLDAPTVATDGPLALQAHHARLAGAVDVGVEQADLGALERQGQREVDCGGGLADPALAGSDRDDVADARQWLQSALHRLGRDLPGDLDPCRPHARVGRQKALEIRGQFLAVAPRREAQLDVYDRYTVLQSDGLHSFCVA
jgi:hypothetical protein